MSIARKILWNTFSQIIGKVFLAGIGFVNLKIITNYLHVAGYGNYTAVYDFIALFGIVSDLGLYTIAVREMAKEHKDIPKIIGNMLTIRTVLALGTMLVALGMAFLYQRPDSNIIFPLAAGISVTATIFALLTGTISTVLQVHYKMQYNAIASVLGKLTAFGYMAYVVFIWHPQDVTSGFYQLLAAGIVGNIVMFSVTYYYAQKLAKIRYRLDWDFIKDVVIKSLPYGIALILNSIYFRIGSIMLYRLVEDGKEQSGIYGVPMRILEAIAIIPLYFMNSVLPTLTQAIKAKTGRYKTIIQYSFDALVMGGTAMAIGTSVLAYQIIHLMSQEKFLSRVSEGFYGSDIALQIVIFALAFSFINTLFGFILVAINRQSKLLYVNAIGAVVAIVLNFILIPKLGARGAAITDVIVEFAVALAAYLMAKKYLQFKLKFTNTLKILFSGAVMGYVVWQLKDPLYHLFNLQNKSIILLILTGAFVYIGMLFLTRVITRDMLDLLRKKDTVHPLPPQENL